MIPRFPWRALVATAVLAAAFPAIAASCSRGEASGAARTRPPPLVAVARAEERDVPVEVQAPVDLRPLEQIDIGSKLLGYLDAVLVDRGDPVKRGQTLALVRPSDLPDQLAAARGQLLQVQATVAQARANHARASQLAPSGYLSQQEMDNARTQLEAAEATRTAVQAQVSALAVRLGETRIQSPIDGVVSARRLDPGALVGTAQGAAVLTVVRVDVLRVFIAVSERHAGKVRTGQPAWVALDALPGRRFEGRVARLAPAFDPGSRTLDAEVHLANPSGDLRPGMYGRAAVVVETHPRAVTVPVAAVQYQSQQAYVFVVGADRAIRRPVRTGVDGEAWLEIADGLRPGEEVIVAGADAVSDGAPVRVARAGSGDAGAPPAAPAGSR